MVISSVSIVGSTSKDHISVKDSNSKAIIKGLKEVFYSATALKIQSESPLF